MKKNWKIPNEQNYNLLRIADNFIESESSLYKDYKDMKLK